MGSVKASSPRFAKIFIVFYTLFFIILYAPWLVGVHSNGAFARAQFVWQDSLFHRYAGSLKPGDPRLILIAVDDETGKKFGFPLPRAVYARALDKLKALGVRTVIFDV